MKIGTVLLAAMLIAAPLEAQAAQGAPSAEETRAVVAAVLGHLASVRGPESGAETCVAGAMAGPPAAPDADDPMTPDHAVRFRFQWHAPEPAAAALPPPPPETPGRRQRQRPAIPFVPPVALAPALAEHLNALRVEAGLAPAPTAPAWIDAALIPAPFHLQGTGGDCAPLTLSAPAFAGDASFVETAYSCGATCGNGSLYALERREGRWEVVGVADLWIS